MGWFAAGFLACGILLTGGTYLCYMMLLKPSADRAMRSVAMTPPPLPHKAGKAVFDAKWTRADGSKLDLAALRGKVVVLNVWATWCPPCMAELPGLAKLAAHFRAMDDVRVVCVSSEAPAEIWPKMNAHEAAPLLCSSYRRQLPELYQTQAIPATFIIDKHGAIAFQHVGAANWAHEDVFRYLEELRLDAKQ